MLELEGSNMAMTTKVKQLEHPACHLESLVPEDDVVTGEKLDKGDCNSCGCIIVLISLQYNTVFPAAPPPPAPSSLTNIQNMLVFQPFRKSGPDL